jgi:hypothetical protein
VRGAVVGKTRGAPRSDGLSLVRTLLMPGQGSLVPRLFSRKGFVDAYLTVDARSLALGRVVLATVLLIDLGRRVPILRDLYSNDGVLPNHTVLWRPPWPQLFSLLFSASHVAEAAAVFALAGVCFLCLLVGWKTRLFQVLSFVMATSLHNRILFVENSGSVALGFILLWTAFLPLGRRFSVDALLRGPREPREAEPPVVSLAVLGLLLQLSVIYAFNFVHKSGATWREGTAVHYMLFQERIVTELGVWVRGQLPFAVTKSLTYGTLIIEAVAPFLVLAPWCRRWTRLVAIALLAGLHAGIALLTNLGIFSAAMFTYLPFLVDGAHWDWLERRWPHGARRVLLRLAASRGVRLVANILVPSLPPGAPSVQRWRRPLTHLREAGVAFVMFVLAAELSVANAAIPSALRWTNRPAWMVSLVMYPHLFEGWSMFAPDSPLRDHMVYVDAVTIGGRHVDPLNEVASRVARLPVDDIPERLGQSSFWCDYELQIPDVGDYWQALSEWIVRYPERTGRPEDAVARFEVWTLQHDSPAPGQRRATNVQRRRLIQWPPNEPLKCALSDVAGMPLR